MSFQFPKWPLATLFLLSLQPAATAQLSSLPGLTAQAEQPVAESAEATDARLQLWLKEARSAFARVNDLNAELKLPEGVTAGDLLDYRRDLEQIILGVGRRQKLLETAPDIRKGLEAARAASSAWKEFSEKPPYSMLLMDDLLNQRDAIRKKEDFQKSSLALYSRTLAGVFNEMRGGDEIGKKLTANAAEEAAEDGVAKWKLEANKAKSRLQVVRATYLQNNLALVQEQLETVKSQLDLLARQIAIAGQKVILSNADLEKVRKASEDREAALEKEGNAIRKRLQDGVTLRTKCQTAVDEMVKTLPEGTEPTAELTLARLKLEASETRLDSLQSIVQMMDLLEQLESYVPDGYQSRKMVLDANSNAEREPALQQLRAANDRLKVFETVNANDLSGINANIAEQQSRAALVSSDDPRMVPLGDIRASLWEKQSVLQRLSHAIAAQHEILTRWLDELDHSKVKKSFTERAGDLWDLVWSNIKGVWNFEVFHYQESVTGAGGPMIENRGVALGRFFIAITFFLVAYFIALGIKNRLRNAVVSRGHVAEAQAKTLSNWLMIVVAFLLVVSTLHFLSIPLTVFAFFGGALAIGLGFGMQTLIKNFISGIIVLFERKIRVGDIVDVGGVTGVIIEVNTRSSVLRSGDGKETLVPNSLFLENRVTNLTLSNRRVRRVLNVSVALESSPQAVSTILKECVERHGLILKDPVPIITFEDFADNAHVFAAYYWTEFNDKTNSDVVASDLRFMIEKRFGEAGIEFPGAKQEFFLRTDQPLQLGRGGKPSEPA